MLLRVLMGVSFCACLQWLKCQVSVLRVPQLLEAQELYLG